MMTLYQEMPKESILSELRARYSPEELDIVRLEIYDLLNTCSTMDQLNSKVYQIIRGKRANEDFKRIHEDNFLSL